MYYTYPGSVSYSYGSKAGSRDFSQLKPLIGNMQNFVNTAKSLPPGTVKAKLESLASQADFANAPTLKALLKGASALVGNAMMGQTSAHVSIGWEDINKAIDSALKIVTTGVDLGVKVVDALDKLGVV